MLFLQYLVVAFLSFGTAAVDDGMQSKECTFTKSKPSSCLYFVLKEDMKHNVSANYCFEQFNGALVPIYKSYEEAKEVMKRYYWWANSDMNVARLRFGMWNYRGTSFKYTRFNPLINFGKDVDMDIWYAFVNIYYDGARFWSLATLTFRDKFSDGAYAESDGICQPVLLRRSFPTIPEDEQLMDIDRALYDETFPYQEPHHVMDDQRTYEYMALKPATMKWSRANFFDNIPFICEVPRFPKAYCEEGWWLHMKSRSCFYLVKTKQSFTESAMKCREIGSNLASINDETENNMALRMIRAGEGYKAKRVWFGLRHEAPRSHTAAADAPDDKKSPEYAAYFAQNLGYNVDGTPVSTFTYFGSNQPDGIRDGSTENCFLFEQRKEGDDFTPEDNKQWWNDYDCSTQGWSICRKMASTQPYRI